MDGVYRRPPMDADDRSATTRAPGTSTLAAVWPLFGLRIRSERLVLRLPTDDDLPRLIDVAKAGIHPPDEMPFGVAWSTAPSPGFERGFLSHHWEARARWDRDDWALHLMVTLDDRPIGAQSILARRFPTFGMVHTGSWLGRAWQGQGLGTEMRSAVLSFAFDGLSARSAETDAFLDNAASNGVTRSIGYEPNGVMEMAPQGVPRLARRYRITAEAWRSRPRPPVTIEGLDGCLELFGAPPAPAAIETGEPSAPPAPGIEG
jgi:RimJ/RimL family protein N-acetyltransferase